MFCPTICMFERDKRRAETNSCLVKSLSSGMAALQRVLLQKHLLGVEWQARESLVKYFSQCETVNFHSFTVHNDGCYKPSTVRWVEVPYFSSHHRTILKGRVCQVTSPCGLVCQRQFISVYETAVRSVSRWSEVWWPRCRKHRWQTTRFNNLLLQ